MGSAAGISRHRSVIVFIVLIGIAAVWLTQRPVGAQTSELVFWSVGGTGGKSTFVNVNQPGLRIGDRLAARGPGVSTFAVLGGTGAYAGASGEATLTDTDEGTEFVIDLS